VGLEIVGDDGDVVVFAQRAEEGVGGVAHVVDEVVAVGCELKEHDGGDGSLGDADASDGLGDTVFEDEEVVGFEAGNELVRLVEDDVGVDVDDGDVDPEGVGIVVRIFNLGCFRSYRGRRFVGLLLFLEDDVATVGLGAGFISWGGGGLLRRGLTGGSVLRVGAWKSGDGEAEG